MRIRHAPTWQQWASQCPVECPDQEVHHPSRMLPRQGAVHDPDGPCFGCVTDHLPQQDVAVVGRSPGEQPARLGVVQELSLFYGVAVVVEHLYLFVLPQQESLENSDLAFSSRIYIGISGISDANPGFSPIKRLVYSDISAL